MDETTIPVKVLRQILAEQGTEAAATASTSHLRARVFGDPRTRNRVMGWACRAGCLSVIDAAVRHGSSASAVSVGSVAGKPVALVGGPAKFPAAKAVEVKALTLQLAAKRGQVEAFGHLITLGARLDQPGTSLASVRALIRLATQGPDAPALLRLLLPGEGAKARLALQLDQQRRDEALLELMRGCAGHRLSRGPSLEEYLAFARALLDAGASPNRCCLDGRGTSMSTLSFAVLSRSPDIARLLLDRGAHIGGPPAAELPRKPRLPLHMPLCAAAHAMADITTVGDAAWDALAQIVQLLLDRGADINACVPFRESALHTDRLASPLLVFLGAVESWDTNSGGQGALEALRLLLDRGASPAPPPSETTPGLRERADARRWNWCAPDGDIVRALLDDWGVHALKHRSFTSALDLLVSHPSYHRPLCATAEMMAAYDHESPAPQPISPGWEATASQEDGVMAGWRALLSSIIQPLSASERSDFLYFYIAHKGTCPEHWARPRSHRAQDHTIGHLARATVAMLLEAGADVNHRASQAAAGSDHDQGEGPTALHAICLWLAGRGLAEEHYNHMYGRFRPRCGGLRHTQQRLDFVRFLVDTCGADAGALFEGRTPAEVLEQLTQPDMDEEEADPWRDNLGEVKQARGCFVGVLRGAAAGSR
ncbi:hypothetical protein RB595_004818 [Gaeumannomyces hyphopodioides]